MPCILPHLLADTKTFSKFFVIQSNALNYAVQNLERAIVGLGSTTATYGKTDNAFAILFEMLERIRLEAELLRNTWKIYKNTP